MEEEQWRAGSRWSRGQGRGKEGKEEGGMGILRRKLEKLLGRQWEVEAGALGGMPPHLLLFFMVLC